MNENERSGTIGLDWLGRGMAVGLVPLVGVFTYFFPHSLLPNSHSSPLSTSI